MLDEGEAIVLRWLRAASTSKVSMTVPKSSEIAIGLFSAICISSS